MSWFSRWTTWKEALHTHTQAYADSKLLSSSLDSSRQQLLGLSGLSPQQVFVGALAVPLEAVLELGGELAKAAVQEHRAVNLTQLEYVYKLIVKY